jgi:hypothetical protein
MTALYPRAAQATIRNGLVMARKRVIVACKGLGPVRIPLSGRGHSLSDTCIISFVYSYSFLQDMNEIL